MSNKKKRKIPQSGTAGPHGNGHSNTITQDMANISLSQRDGAGDRDGLGLDDDGTTYAAGNSYGYVHNSPGSVGGGLSGPGRGRFGRSGRGSMDRRPLGEFDRLHHLTHSRGRSDPDEDVTDLWCYNGFALRLLL